MLIMLVIISSGFVIGHEAVLKLDVVQYGILDQSQQKLNHQIMVERSQQHQNIQLHSLSLQIQIVVYWKQLESQNNANNTLWDIFKCKQYFLIKLYYLHYLQ